MNSTLHRRGGVVLAGALACGALAFMPAANAVPTGTISGTVTNGDGAAVPNVEVQSFELVDGAWLATDAAFTDDLGEYSLPLEVGEYRIGFREGSDYIEEFFDDATDVESASTLEILQGGDSVVADAELVRYSTIRGTVTNASDAPYAGVEVYARTEGGNEWADVADQATTDASGNYSLEGLEEGTYRVEFEASTGENTGIYEAYNNKGDFDDADDIAVGSEATVPAINAKLVQGEHDPLPFTMTAMPTISGTPQVGNTLTATGGSWVPTPATTEYYWFIGQDYTGVSGPTYTLTAADLGKTLSVLVQVYGPGGQYDFANTGEFGPIVAASAPTPPAVVTPVPAPTPAPAPAPVISFSKKIDVAGALTVGATLKLKNFQALVSRAVVSYKIQWYAGAKKIKKATKSKLKVTQALQGKKISVKVSATSGTTTKTVKVKVGKIR